MIFDVLHKRIIYAVVILGILRALVEVPLPYLFGLWLAIVVSYTRKVPHHRQRSVKKR